MRANLPLSRHVVELRSGAAARLLQTAGDGAPVLLLHESPMSSGQLIGLAQELAGAGFTPVAADLPGYGGSDPLARARPSVGDYAAWVVDVLDALDAPAAHLYGIHTGAQIALAAAVRAPERLRSLVLDGLPLFTLSERAELLAENLPSFAARPDGTHLIALWQRYRDHQLFWPWFRRATETRIPGAELPSADWLQQRVVDFLLAGEGYGTAFDAIFRDDPVPALGRLRPRTLVTARERDILAGHLPRLPALPEQVAVEPGSRSLAQHAARIAAFLADGPQPPALRRQSRVTRTAFVGPPGGQVHAERSGPRDAPAATVVIADPFAGSALDALPPGDEAQVRLTLPGTGDSDPIAGMDRIADVAARLARALDDLDVPTSAAVEGDGLGALVALELVFLRRCAGARLGPPPPELGAGSALPALPSLVADHSGRHLVEAWWLARERRLFSPWWERRATSAPFPAPSTIHADAVALLRAAPHHADLLTGAARHAVGDRLAAAAGRGAITLQGDAWPT